jgi:hypothetical protein
VASLTQRVTILYQQPEAELISWAVEDMTRPVEEYTDPPVEEMGDD